MLEATSSSSLLLSASPLLSPSPTWWSTLIISCASSKISLTQPGSRYRVNMTLTICLSLFPSCSLTFPPLWWDFLFKMAAIIGRCPFFFGCFFGKCRWQVKATCLCLRLCPLTFTHTLVYTCISTATEVNPAVDRRGHTRWTQPDPSCFCSHPSFPHTLMQLIHTLTLPFCIPLSLSGWTLLEPAFSSSSLNRLTCPLSLHKNKQTHTSRFYQLVSQFLWMPSSA